MKNHFNTAFTWIFIMVALSSCEKSSESLDHNSLIGVWQLINSTTDQEGNHEKDSELKVSYVNENCATIFGPCNFGTANYSIDGNVVVVDYTKQRERCEDKTESDFILGLSGSYKIYEDTLTIISSSNTEMRLIKSSIDDPYNCDFSILLVDTIESNNYYTEEIFNSDYSKIYGKWSAYAKTGGWKSEKNATISFDYLEVKSSGIYGITKNFDVLEFGMIQIERQTEEELRLLFLHDPNSKEILGANNIKVVSFSGNDSIIIYDRCLDCYQTYLVRIN